MRLSTTKNPGNSGAWILVAATASGGIDESCLGAGKGELVKESAVRSKTQEAHSSGDDSQPRREGILIGEGRGAAQSVNLRRLQLRQKQLGD